MGLYKYSQKEDEAKVARAQGYDMDISYKDLTNICAAIRGKSVDKARKILQDVIDMRMPIAYHKFNTGLGHRSQLGGQKGRFPKKECKAMQGILENAIANALTKGFDESILIVKNTVAYKQNVLPRYRRTFVGGAALGYGKQALRSDYITTRVEITLTEEPRIKSAKAKKAEAAKKETSKKAAKEAPAAKKAEKPVAEEKKAEEPKKE